MSQGKRSVSYTEALAIRRAFRQGYTPYQLQRQYGVSQPVMSRLLSKKTYRKPAYRARHGQSWPTTRLYSAWKLMLARCTQPSSPSYSAYGGRGIQVCQRWRRFEAFAADMGEHPGNEWSIERKNVNGHYTPSNCIWLLRKLQMRNTRDTKLSPQKVRDLRLLAKQGWSDRDLARMYGASVGAIQQARQKLTWADIA